MRIWLSTKTQDEEFNDLRAAGHTGSLNDMQFAYLAAAGYSGALADKMAAAAGGDFTAPVLSGNSFNDTTDAATFSTTEGGTFIWATHLTTESVSANGSGGWTGNTLETGTDTVASSGESTISAAYTATTGTGGESRKFSYYIRDAAGNDSNVITETFTVNSSYTANAVDFGTGPGTSYNTSYAVSSTQQLTLHFSLLSPTTWDTSGYVFVFTAVGSERVVVNFASSGRLSIYALNSTPATIASFTFPASRFAADTWYTITMSLDLATNDGSGNGTSLVYVGDTKQTSWSTTPTCTLGATIDATNRIYVPDGGTAQTHYLSNLFVESAFYDLDTVATRRQFVDASGKPVDISSLGSPHTRFTGDAAGWATNTGSNGNLTISGTINNAPSSPTD